MWHLWTLVVGTWSCKHTRGVSSLTSSRFFSRHSQTTTTWRRQEVSAAVSVRLSVCIRADEDELQSAARHVCASLLLWNDVQRIKLPAVFLSNKHSAGKFQFLQKLTITLFIQAKPRTTSGLFHLIRVQINNTDDIFKDNLHVLWQV